MGLIYLYFLVLRCVFGGSFAGNTPLFRLLPPMSPAAVVYNAFAILAAVADLPGCLLPPLSFGTLSGAALYTRRILSRPLLFAVLPCIYLYKGYSFPAAVAGVLNRVLPALLCFCIFQYFQCAGRSLINNLLRSYCTIYTTKAIYITNTYYTILLVLSVA